MGLGGIVDDVTGGISDAWDDATDAVSDGWDDVTDELGRAWDNTTDFVSEEWDRWGKDAFWNLTTGGIYGAGKEIVSFLQPEMPDFPEEEEKKPKHPRERPQMMHAPGSQHTSSYSSEGRRGSRQGIRSLMIPLNTSGGSSGRTGLRGF